MKNPFRRRWYVLITDAQGAERQIKRYWTKEAAKEHSDALSMVFGHLNEPGEKMQHSWIEKR